jgi:hypothetical protein
VQRAVSAGRCARRSWCQGRPDGGGDGVHCPPSAPVQWRSTLDAEHLDRGGRRTADTSGPAHRATVNPTVTRRSARHGCPVPAPAAGLDRTRGVLHADRPGSRRLRGRRRDDTGSRHRPGDRPGRCPRGGGGGRSGVTARRRPPARRRPARTGRHPGRPGRRGGRRWRTWPRTPPTAPHSARPAGARWPFTTASRRCSIAGPASSPSSPTPWSRRRAGSGPAWYADDTWMYGRVDAPMTEGTPWRPVSSRGVLRARLAERMLHAAAAGRLQVSVVRGGAHPVPRRCPRDPGRAAHHGAGRSGVTRRPRVTAHSQPCSRIASQADGTPASYPNWNA